MQKTRTTQQGTKYINYIQDYGLQVNCVKHLHSLLNKILHITNF